MSIQLMTTMIRGKELPIDRLIGRSAFTLWVGCPWSRASSLIDGQVKTRSDGKGTYTYTYDGTDAAGKAEHRGLLAKQNQCANAFSGWC